MTWDDAMTYAITLNRTVGWKAWRVRVGMMGLCYLQPVYTWDREF